MLKKLLKGLLWLLLLLVVAVCLFVWQGLGVNPFESDEDHLWDLVSNQVDFFARFPGTDVLREPVVEGLGEEEGFEWILHAKDALAQVARDVAREVNPQIPLGLFQVDLENDMRGKEVAIGGVVFKGLRVPRLDHFVVLVRIPGYAKFVSALQRDFVKSKIEGGDRISVVRGLYFKIKDPQLAEVLAPLRSGAAREEPDALWFARIRDVLLVTDQPQWIEDALRGGADTLPADVDFKTEFIPVSVRKGDIEVHMRPGLWSYYGRPDQRGGPLDALSRLVPAQVLGNMVVQATPEKNGVAVSLVNYPLQDAFTRSPPKPYLVKLYDREKADLRFDYTENGIGRFLPRRGVVGAIVLHADSETFAALAMDLIPDADRSNLDSLARRGIGGGRAYGSYEALLTEIGKDLADTHMLVIHRPAIFDTVDLSGADPPDDWKANPPPQPSFSFVSAVKDSAAPEKVVEKITENLRFLGLKKPEDAQSILHPSGKYYVVDPEVLTGDYSLFHPAYAAITEGGKFFVFTSSPENMEAILAAAQDPHARLLAEPGVAECAGRLPAEGTLSVLARGRAIGDYLADWVRTAFVNETGLLGPLMDQWRQSKRELGVTDEDKLDDLVLEEKERYKVAEYPRFRDNYRRRCGMLGVLDTAVFGLALGVGPAKMVTGKGYALLHGAAGARE